MADPRERFNDLEESIRIAVDRHLSGVWTAMPVKVLKDSDGHRVDLQITVKGQSEDLGGQLTAQDIAPLEKVVIHFNAGGGLTATHPVKAGDEGMAVFQSRCIDNWTEDGGQQEEPYRRRHELSDAMFVPGFRNKPRQLDPPPSTNSYQLRTDSGQYFIELTDDGVVNIWAKEVNIHSPRINMDGKQRDDKGGEGGDADTHVEVKGWIHATRDITTDQNVHAKINVDADQIVHGHHDVLGGNPVSLVNHTHRGVRSGPEISGPPVTGGGGGGGPGGDGGGDGGDGGGPGGDGSVAALEAQIAELRAQLNDLSGRVVYRATV